MQSEWRWGGGHESGNRLPHASLAPPSSHLKPALGHSVHVPPHGAGGCGRGRALRASGVQRREAPGRPGSYGTWRRQGSGGQRPSGGEGRPLDSDWASSTSRGAGGSDDCSSLALLSPQPQLQPKTKTLPTCQQRRSSLGRAARASERRGEGGGGAHGGGGGAGPPLPPLPGSAGDGPPESSRRVAAARVRSRLSGRQAHREQERQGSAYVSVCICVWEGLWGGCECARARGPGREGKQDNYAQHRSPVFPSAGM